jgi:peptide/nickel transport system permease protein
MSPTWRRFGKSRPGLVGLALVALLLAAAALAPRLAARPPLETSAAAFRPPGAARLLGTDNLGRDVWSGLVHGARVSLLVGVLSAAFAALIGVAVGAAAGATGGRVDAALMRLSDLLQTIPQFFLALLIVALAGRGLWKIIAVLAILGWPLTARLVRAEFLSLRECEFVEAARALGMSDLRIAVLVILPNATPPAIVAATLGVAEAVLLESGLSFFGLGDPNLMSWGLMLQNAQGFLRRAWWMAVFPGLAIFTAVLAFNLFGDGLSDALNPRLRQRT